MCASVPYSSDDVIRSNPDLRAEFSQLSSIIGGKKY